MTTSIGVLPKQNYIHNILAWRHDMKTLSASLALCEGVGGFPSQRVGNAKLWYFICCQTNQGVMVVVEISDKFVSQ